MDRKKSETITPHPQHATRAQVLRWEAAAWFVVGAAWIASAWPGLLVDWDDPATALAAGLLLTAVGCGRQALRHGATHPAPGDRALRHRPGRRAKSRRHIAATVVADAAVIGGSGVAWCVAARNYGWPESVTGGSLQVAFGTAFACWAVLHLPAIRRIRGGDLDAPVTSRRVLGTGPMTVAPVGLGQSRALDAAEAQARRRRIRRTQRWLLNPPMRTLTCAGLMRHHVVLETTGRITGRRRRTVVGVALEPDAVWIVAENGTRAGYVRNIGANPRVRVHLRGRWLTGLAEVVEGDDVTRRLGAFRPGHAATVRRFADNPATLRVRLSAAA
jgi:deazaflavin-dependent oxidoreductase (nitroreductase family)